MKGASVMHSAGMGAAYILPIDSVNNLPRSFKYWFQSVREFIGRGQPAQ